MVDSHCYADWRTALSQVQGIYLITDTSSGRHDVGKADGTERILGRWRSYARDGHGGNVGLRELSLARERLAAAQSTPISRARHFAYSILRVFGPSTSPSEVDEAESHFKRALMTREFGLNRN
ncbi:MAG: GIY-YIG nuclease family protein [Tessaracoccus sp.]|uniref:GIY-YIG nuclease family protein n=1 Tax=Tessaracoccus sp. TaxID=1971211 RepID=UPI001ECFE6C8|nr:GIY-YIG nuclease family protein [Tessaracoccus sp.]MBK7822502.1 GIY-YIG nuclease family protein [Tessaracoccus sp.]